MYRSVPGQADMSKCYVDGVDVNGVDEDCVDENRFDEYVGDGW